MCVCVCVCVERERERERARVSIARFEKRSSEEVPFIHLSNPLGVISVLENFQAARRGALWRPMSSERRPWKSPLGGAFFCPSRDFACRPLDPIDPRRPATRPSKPARVLNLAHFSEFARGKTLKKRRSTADLSKLSNKRGKKGVRKMGTKKSTIYV